MNHQKTEFTMLQCNPCLVKVHEEASHLLLSWLESVGPVRWLVVPSATHTLLLHDAIKAFPNAKIAGPEAAEAKLKHAKACEKFDYVTTNEEDLKKLRSNLAGEGVDIEEVAGDVASNAVVLFVHKEVLLECDLLHGHDDGHGVYNCDEATLRQWKNDSEMTGWQFNRLFVGPSFGPRIGPSFGLTVKLKK